MIVAGIGVTPVTDMLTDSGLELNNGVVVNEFLETNQPGIWAAGDVANYPDLLFGKRKRVEHWDNAVSQGQHCGRVLMGDRTAFKHVPYFFSDIFDLSYEYWGDSAETDEIVLRGDVLSNSFSVWWLKEKIVRAAFTMNRDEEERSSAPKWIESKQRVLPGALADASRPSRPQLPPGETVIFLLLPASRASGLCAAAFRFAAPRLRALACACRDNAKGDAACVPSR